MNKSFIIETNERLTDSTVEALKATLETEKKFGHIKGYQILEIPTQELQTTLIAQEGEI